jgi:SpoVK/Ycf46/Vps4 family AAA+-type ATPase
VVQLFTEVQRHKPSVIYIPNVDVWYRTVGSAVISTFLGLLRMLAPTDPVLLLGILECEEEYVDQKMVKDLFGYSRSNKFEISRPDRVSVELVRGNPQSLTLSSNHATSTWTLSLTT